MDKQQNFRRVLLAAVLGAFGMSGIALAAEKEREPNEPIGNAQQLSLSSDAVANTGAVGVGTGGVTVDGVIGNPTGDAIFDVDFYSFWGQGGDVVTIDIDGGYGGDRNVDTILAIFGPGPTYTKLREIDDIAVDPGSTSPKDARISLFSLPATGTYTVAVSSYPCRIDHGGIKMLGCFVDPNSRNDTNGDYTLIISGVTLLVEVQQINIDIKPGSGESAPINPKSMGHIPVALLSSSQFNALTVDPTTLTFGATGDEQSWLRCAKEGEDVNGDTLLDLVCHFGNRHARFTVHDTEGIVKGKTKPEAGGTQFEGRGPLKVVPVKRNYD